jgi:O-antigen/teichoic acid export membrane protein
LQIANAIIYSSDNIIIARLLGPEAVTDYAVPAKLFFLVPSFLYMVLAPLWPAYAEAYARGDLQWARKTLIQAVFVTFGVCSLASLVLILGGDQILQMWIGSEVTYSQPLMVALGTWITLSTVITALAMFLNAVNKIGFQAVFSFLAAALAIVFKVIFASKSGLTGIVWGNILAATYFMLIPYTVYLAKEIWGQRGFRNQVSRST